MVNFCSIWPAMTTWETVNWALFFAARAFCFGWFYWFKVKGSSRFNDMLGADVCRICLAVFAFFCKKWSWFHHHDVVGNLIYSLSLKFKCKLKTNVMRSMCVPWEVGCFFLQMPLFGPGEVRTYSVHRGKWQRLRRIKCSEWCCPLLTQLHTVKWLRPR